MHVVVPQKFIKDPSFIDALQKLEVLTHHHGIDVRYATDVKLRVGTLVTSLKLDEHDSTIHEVHSALLAFVEDIKHDFEKNIHSALRHKKNTETNYDRQFVELIEATLTETTSFSIKHSVAKKLIKSLGLSVPTLSALHHRTITSLLKRESLQTILVAALQFEDTTWWTAVSERIRLLQPSDFEKQPLEIAYYHKSYVKQDQADKSKKMAIFLLMGFHCLDLDTIASTKHGQKSSFLERAIEVIDSYNNARLQLLRVLHSAYSSHKFELLLRQCLDNSQSLECLSLYQTKIAFVQLLQQSSTFITDSFLVSDLSYIEKDDVRMNDIYNSLYFYCPMIKRYQGYDDVYFSNGSSVLLCGLRNIIGHHSKTGYVVAALMSRYIDAMYAVGVSIGSEEEMPAVLRLIRERL